MSDKHYLDDLSRAKRDLSVLYEVSHAMRSTLELNHILYIILTGVTAHHGLGFNRAILFLVDEKHRVLKPVTAIGPESGEHAQKVWDYITQESKDLDDLIDVNQSHVQMNTSSPLFESVKNLEIPLTIDSQNLLSQVFHSGDPLHLDSGQIEGYQNDPLIKSFKTNEAVIMPLRAKDRVNGLIVADNLYSQKNVSHEDLRIFQMLANQAGLAIENSQLYELVKHRSHTDALTGLWNHGFFQSQLSTEIKKLAKHKKPISLLLIDIDHFKLLNDRFGHQNGDVVIKQLATILNQSSRNMDYACRYGGEEFGVILTDTNKNQALDIAERIRKNTHDFKFPSFSTDENLHITVSIGVASIPDDALTKEELIAQADKALYISKFSGRNQTTLAKTN